MAMDFPDSPAVNDTFTVGSRQWKFDGATWLLVGTPRNNFGTTESDVTSRPNYDTVIFIGSTEPTVGQSGDVWIDNS